MYQLDNCLKNVLHFFTVETHRSASTQRYRTEDTQQLRNAQPDIK